MTEYLTVEVRASALRDEKRQETGGLCIDVLGLYGVPEAVLKRIYGECLGVVTEVLTEEGFLDPHTVGIDLLGDPQ